MENGKKSEIYNKHVYVHKIRLLLAQLYTSAKELKTQGQTGGRWMDTSSILVNTDKQLSLFFWVFVCQFNDGGIQYPMTFTFS